MQGLGREATLLCTLDKGETIYYYRKDCRRVKPVFGEARGKGTAEK